MSLFEGIVIGVFPSNSDIQVEFNNGEIVRIPTYLPIVADEDNSNYENVEKTEPLSTKLLTLSWANTIHKAQGSEWKVVIFYLPKGRGLNGFFNRKLAYTGASRSIETLRVVAENMESFTGIFYVDPPHRHDNLAKRLRKEEFVEHYIDPVYGTPPPNIRQGLLT